MSDTDEYGEEYFEEEMHTNKLEGDTSILLRLLGYFTLDSDIPDIQESLKNYYGKNIQSSQNRIFLNPAYSIEDLKQHILEHYDDDDFDEKSEFFDYLIEDLDKLSQHKRNEGMDILHLERTKIENNMKLQNGLHDEITKTINGSKKKQQKLISSSIIKPLINDKLKDSTNHIILRDILDTIDNKIIILEQELIDINSQISALNTKQRVDITIKKEDLTPKKEFLENVNPNLLKQWIKDFYDSAHFRLMFDKNACENINVNKLTEIAKDNNISLAPKYKESIKYAVPLTKWDKKAEIREKMYDKKKGKKGEEDVPKSLTKQEKCDRIFEKLSEDKIEPYILEGKVFYFRKPFKKTMGFVYYLQNKGNRVTNRTLSNKMQLITCPVGYKSWNKGTLCCGGLPGKIVDVAEDNVGTSRCFTSHFNPKVEEIDKQIKMAKTELKKAKIKKDKTRFENQLSRLIKERNDLPPHLEIQHTQPGGPKVCALVSHTQYEFCSTYKEPVLNPFYDTIVWKLNKKIYTDKPVPGSDGNFKDYLKAYIIDLANKYKNPKTSVLRKKEIKSNANDIKNYLNTGIIEKFTLLQVKVLKNKEPTKKVKKIKKTSKDVPKVSKKELEIKKEYNIPADKSLAYVDTEYIRKHMSKEKKEKITTIIKKTLPNIKPRALKIAVNEELDMEAQNIYTKLLPYRKKHVSAPKLMAERKKIETKKEVKSKHRPVFATYSPPKSSTPLKSEKSKKKLDLATYYKRWINSKKTKKLKLKESRDRVTEKYKKSNKGKAKPEAKESKSEDKESVRVRAVQPFRHPPGHYVNVPKADYWNA